MNNTLNNISVDVINKAVFNVAVEHKLIKKMLYSESYIDSYQSFSCVQYITSMRNLATPINFGSGHATWAEYLKLINLFNQGFAKTKNMSIEAAQEILATEVKVITTVLDINQAKVAAQEKKIQEIAKIIVYIIPILAGSILLFVIFNSITKTATQRYLNTQELESLRNENQQLERINSTLKSQLDKLEQFQQESDNLENLKAENQALKQKNKNLNERLIQCKKPFWERNCN
jgi:cell division protein FtsB